MRKLILAVFVMSGLTVAAQQAAAHGGGLNREGCHRETATGGYHCHRKKDEKGDDIDWALAGGVAGGVLILWVLIDRLKDDRNAFAERLHLAPLLSDDKAGIAAEYTPDGAHRLGFRAETEREERGESYMGMHWRVAF